MPNFSDKDTCYKNKSRTFDPALKGERRGYNRELGLYTARLWSGPSVQNDRRAEGKTEFFQFFMKSCKKIYSGVHLKTIAPQSWRWC